MMTATEKRRASLAKVHIAKKELGLDDETYRDILRLHFRAKSAADLNERQLTVLLNKFVAKGWQPRRAKAGAGSRPKNMTLPGSRAAQMKKIEALLTVGKRPWAYADAMAKRICRVDRVAWVPAGDLCKIIAALNYQAKREGWDLSGARR